MPEIDQNLSQYSIVEKIRQGGMGEVYRARNLTLGRGVAIKKINEQHGKQFRQEAKAFGGEAVEAHPF
jgi:serine/threonine protein kinase